VPSRVTPCGLVPGRVVRFWCLTRLLILTTSGPGWRPLDLAPPDRAVSRVQLSTSTVPEPRVALRPGQRVVAPGEVVGTPPRIRAPRRRQDSLLVLPETCLPGEGVHSLSSCGSARVVEAFWLVVRS